MVYNRGMRKADYITIHEDFYGMRNLYPAAGYDDAAADIEASIAFGQEHWDGAGFDACRAIEPPAGGWLDTDLTCDAVCRAVAPHLPRVRKLSVTPYGPVDSGVFRPGIDPPPEGYCFGFSEECFLAINEDGERVRSIWFEVFGCSQEEYAALRAAMEAIDALVPAAVADYWADRAAKVADFAAMDAYFQELYEIGLQRAK